MVVVTGNLGILSQSQIEQSIQEGALPSSVVKKDRRLKDKGIFGGRTSEAVQKIKENKIKADFDERFSKVESFMNALGVKTASRKKLKESSLISGLGPVAGIGGGNQFKQLQDKVTIMEKSQKSIALMLGGGANLIGGASGLTNPTGLINVLGGVISKFGLPVAAITKIALQLRQAHIDQYGGGKTRDVRKLVLSEDVSRIGIENENEIESGANLFMSNPQVLSGLARGPSNTENLREGMARYKQRHEGTYGR